MSTKVKPSVYQVKGNQIFVKDDLNPPKVKTIKPAIYTLGFHPMAGFCLEYQQESFELPDKIYGDLTPTMDRIIHTHAARAKEHRSTGVLLEGLKGSGKTLLSKMIANKVGMPVILVHTPFAGSDFNLFVQSLPQQCMFLFDEFEKVYTKDSERQEALLSLFDGSYPTQHLYLMTVNESRLCNTNMIDRPGRIFYRIRYKGLPEDFIFGYAEDHLKNKNHLEGLKAVCGFIWDISFDQLQAILEEMNRYNEPAATAVNILNITVGDYARRYAVTVESLKGESEWVVLHDHHILQISREHHIVLVREKFKKSLAKATSDDDSLMDVLYRSQYVDETSPYVKGNLKDIKALESIAKEIVLGSEDLKSINHPDRVYVYEKDGFRVTFKYDPEKYTHRGVAGFLQ